MIIRRRRLDKRKYEEKGVPENVMELSPVLKKTVNLKNNLMLKEKWDRRLRARPHAHVSKICEKELKESLSSEGSNQQKKVNRCIIVQELEACSSHIRQ